MLYTVKYVDERINNFIAIFTEPPVEKLLPDMPRPPPGYALPKTLVLDLKGTILSTEYVFGKGF